jgi:hypothetical protein
MAVVRTDDSEKLVTSIPRVETISELRTMLAVTGKENHTVRTDISKERVASIFREERSSELRITLAVTIKMNHIDGSDTFLRNVGSNEFHTAPHLRRWHSSYSPPRKPQIVYI